MMYLLLSHAYRCICLLGGAQKGLQALISLRLVLLTSCYSCSQILSSVLHHHQTQMHRQQMANMSGLFQIILWHIILDPEFCLSVTYVQFPCVSLSKHRRQVMTVVGGKSRTTANSSFTVFPWPCSLWPPPIACYWFALHGTMSLNPSLCEVRIKPEISINSGLHVVHAKLRCNCVVKSLTLTQSFCKNINMNEWERL